MDNIDTSDIDLTILSIAQAALIFSYRKGLRISFDGTSVVNTKTGNSIKPYYNKLGYPTFTVRYLNCNRNVAWHRLQALQKFGLKILDDGILVRHLDGDRKNNHLENIAIGSASDNALDMPEQLRKETALAGGRATRALTWDQALAIRSSSKTAKELSIEFNVSQNTIYRIKNSKMYLKE